MENCLILRANHLMFTEKEQERIIHEAVNVYCSSRRKRKLHQQPSNQNECESSAAKIQKGIVCHYDSECACTDDDATSSETNSDYDTDDE